MIVVGQVNWFGGLNKERNTINNFGFITPCGVANSEKIFVHRNNVPKYLQDLLEANKGEGVYVEFEIEIDKANRQSAVNVELKTFISTVSKHESGRLYINYEDRYDIYLKSSSSLKVGDILYFGLRHRSNYTEAISIQKIEASCQNIEIIEKCIHSDNPEIFKVFLAQYAKSISKEEAKSLILKKIEPLNPSGKCSLMNKLESICPYVILESPQLRNIFNEYNSNGYACFIDKYLGLVDENLIRELVDELIEILRGYTDSQRSFYWDRIKYLIDNLEYKGYLWNIAPTTYQKQVIQSKYQKFFEVVSQFDDSDYPYSQATSLSCTELYNFTENDNKLIQKWVSDVPEYDSFAKMMSARGAEKLVIKFYETLLGNKVEDISIHQVTKESEDWKVGDICLNSKDLIDVKNARKSNNSNVYSEFCVQRHKKNQGSDVKIIAVLSPMCGRQDMEDAIISSRFDNPKVLGSFDKTTLKKLEEFFISERLSTIQISREGNSNNYLPPWLFDYDDLFYIKQIEITAKFKQLTDVDIPKWEDVLIINEPEKFFSIFITSKRKLPPDWQNNLRHWEKEFINDLTNLPVERISLPYIFLSLLRHFLTMLSSNDLEYSPHQYLNILRTGWIGTYPLKVYDPLDIIKDFCESLQSIWQYRESKDLTKFKIFRFDGQGLLQGKHSEGDPFKKILAYCGGKTDKGKCGCTPLVIGKHETCEFCKFLICPIEKCECCSEGCKSYQKKLKKREDLKLTKRRLPDIKAGERKKHS